MGNTTFNHQMIISSIKVEQFLSCSCTVHYSFELPLPNNCVNVNALWLKTGKCDLITSHRHPKGKPHDNTHTRTVVISTAAERRQGTHIASVSSFRTIVMELITTGRLSPSTLSPPAEPRFFRDVMFFSGKHAHKPVRNFTTKIIHIPDTLLVVWCAHHNVCRFTSFVPLKTREAAHLG